MTLATPHTLQEIGAALGEGEAHLLAFFGALTPATMFGSVGDKWSPDQHLRHLTLTLRRIRQGLAALLPLAAPLPLLERWRVPVKAGGRTYPQLCEDYRTKLAGGAQAPSAYVAPPTPAAQRSAARQDRVVRTFAAASWTLRQALHHPLWSERALDTLKVPHDLLGTVSLRELLFFTVYHNVHHLAGVRASLEHA
ncbi:hypothetical protein DKM44_12230 [Deinococcus irradiatisoli]|uniref:Uncharacterized protein n=1 Tax=Deinococcus irradiatisoli TaxID=2202254 RepID=A0A2Z3JK07_9DEIO|nr:DinB family protein [Deinococcus irradiatisoli]AWN23901.1 hypothetical protein DKM44_12230 [Deinococcus irradiatisoli]